jgi:hypothetical protein
VTTTTAVWPAPRSTWRALVVFAPVAALAVLLTGAIVAVKPVAAVALLVVVVLCIVVWRQPWISAVLILAITPLVAGIDRGRLIPMLRPNEALTFGLAGLLMVRAVFRAPVDWRWWRRLSRLELALVGLAVTSSFVPLLFMVVRGRAITGDDLSYAIVLWKFLVVYAVVRHSVTTDRQVRWCLWACLASSALVGAIGFLQARDMLGVRSILLTYWTPFGYADAVDLPRGGSTIGLPAATADLMILSLGIAAGMWRLERRGRALVLPLGCVCGVGVIAAAEFSSFLGLLVAVVALTWLLDRLDLLRWAPLGLVAGLVAAWPLVQERLNGFQMASGLPVSWTSRYYNLTTYFVPDLVKGWNPVFGVRPSARVVVVTQGTGYVWIESGYMWLIWGGGLPLLIAFVFFVHAVFKVLAPQARGLSTYADVAALSVVTFVVAMLLLMLVDMHLTYRGATDAMYALIALAAVRPPPRPADPPRLSAPETTGARR